MLSNNMLPNWHSTKLIVLILLLPSVFGSTVECPENCHCNSESTSNKALVCSQMPQGFHLFGYENLTLNSSSPIAEFEPDSVFPLVSLQNLVMDDVGLMSIKANRKMPPADHLRTLSLNNNKLLRLTPDDFSWCTNLNELRLANNSIKEIHHDTFVPLQFLEILDLANNNLQILDFMLMTPLTVLDLSNNEIDDIAPTGIELPNLKNLQLCGNHFKEVSAIQTISVRGLLKLCLGDSISSLNQIAFAATPDLRELELVGKGLLDEDFSATGRILTHLQILTMSFFQIEGLSKGSFAHFDELLELHLKSIKATHRSLDHDTFSKLTKLRVLDLKGSSELAASFFETENMQLPLSIQVVSLQETKLSTIRNVAVLRNLTEVDLSHNPLLCNQALRGLLNLILNGSLGLANPNETRCVNPENVHGKNILDHLVVAGIFDKGDTDLRMSEDYMELSQNQTNESEIEKFLDNIGVNIESLFYFAAAMLLTTVILFFVLLIVICICLTDRRKNLCKKDSMEGFVRADNEYTFDNFTLTETLAECHRRNYSLTDDPRLDEHKATSKFK